MPGLRSLVARRRSTLASPQYTSSKTPPPNLPSTSSAFFIAQKIERRCSSLPGQVSLEPDEDSKFVDPCGSGSNIFNGISNGSFLDSKNSNSEGQNARTDTSSGAIKSSESANKSVIATSSSSNSSSLKSNSAMEIESTLAKRGVTVVRRMVDTDETLKSNKKEVIASYPLKDSVITPNPLLAKEANKSNEEGIPKQLGTIPTSAALSNFTDLPEQSKHSILSGLDSQSSNASQELCKQTPARDLCERSERSVNDTQTGAGQAHSHPDSEARLSTASVFSEQAIASNRDSTINSNTIRFGAQSYYNQAHQQIIKEAAAHNNPLKSTEYPNIKETLCTNTPGPFKSNSSGMSAPLGSSVLPSRSVGPYSPQSRSASSYQQSKTTGQLAQFAETSSPLSKSSEVSPQPRSAEMSPYSRSSEASPASRTAQVSPHSRSSQMSPLSRSVKVSPHSRSAEVSPQSRAQASPLMRSGELSPKSRYIGLSPQSSSVESPQARSSGIHSQSLSAGHQSHSASVVNPPLHVGHPHLPSTERHMAPTMSMGLTSQSAPVGPTQQGGNPGRLASGASAGSFPNITASDFLGRSAAELFPSCNSSEVLSGQSNPVGFSTQLNSGGFSMHSNPGSYTTQSNNVTFPTQATGYPLEANSAHFPGINNVPGGGMIANANSMGGFGHLSNCSGFPLHEISGVYAPHPNPYNIHSSANELRSSNPAEVLNYPGSREFSMHTPYREYSSYNSSSQVSTPLRSQDITAHNQRDILANHSSRELPLQNCNQAMPLHPSVRDPSLNSLGREPQMHPNYGEQHMQSGYREPPAFQRSNSDISSLPPENRDSSLRQNYREPLAPSNYKPDPLSNSYRSSAQHSIRSTPAPPYRDHPVLSNASNYQSPSNTRGANILNSFRDPSVIANYREQDVLSNYLSTSETPVASNFREPVVHSGSRDQAIPNYRGLVNHTSPTEQSVSMPSYQDTINPSNPRNQVHANYPETVNHASPSEAIPSRYRDLANHTSPSETIPSRYRDLANHTSPGEQVSSFGESVSRTNSREVLAGFQEMRGRTGSSEQALGSFRDPVDHTSPREQVMSGFQHSVNHTSPRHQALPSFKEAVSQVIPAEQSIPSYRGTIDHTSPRDQAFTPLPKDGSHVFREGIHTSPRQSLPIFGETVGQTSPRKSLSNFSGSAEHASPRQQVVRGFKESADYGNIRESLDQRSSAESSDCVSGYEESISHTPSEAGAANNYGELHGLQNFRVHSQHRSPNEFGGNCSEMKTAVLPSFTESFENTSHNKLCFSKPLYKGAKETSLYIDSSAMPIHSGSEKYCESTPYEKLSPCSSNRDVYVDPSNKDAGIVSDTSNNEEDSYVDSCDRNALDFNDSSPLTPTDIEDNPEELETQECSSPAKCPDVQTAENESVIDPPTCLNSNDDKIEVQEDSNTLVPAYQNSTESGDVNYGASPSKTISSEVESTAELSSTVILHEKSQPEESLTSPTRSSADPSSGESPEKIERGESSGKCSLGTSPSSQERIVIKMKLLHSKPGDEDNFRNGKHSGHHETGSDKGSYIRYPMVKYTRWTIDSIINGREDGGTEVLGPDKSKENDGERKEDDEEEELYSDVDHGSPPPKSTKRARKRTSEAVSECKVTKFDTNKNLMKKSLKITIMNPLRARVSPVENTNTESFNSNSENINTCVKQENIDTCIKQENIDPCVEQENIIKSVKKEPEELCSNVIFTDDRVLEKSEREISSLRKVRKDQDKSVRFSPTSPNVESHISSSSASRASRASRRLSCPSDVTSDGFASVASVTDDLGANPVTRIKKCSIVIKRIYTEDNYSCYSSSLCDKNSKVNLCGGPPSTGNTRREPVRRPKRKAAIEANEKRHKSLRSFDRSLEISNNINAEKVPYNGPANKNRNSIPLLKSPTLVQGQKDLTQCSVLVCDIFMNRRINKMTCPGCSRKYDSSDSVQVNINKLTISFMCCQCRWLVVKDVQPHEVEAMAPR